MRGGISSAAADADTERAVLVVLASSMGRKRGEVSAVANVEVLGMEGENAAVTVTANVMARATD